MSFIPQSGCAAGSIPVSRQVYKFCVSGGGWLRYRFLSVGFPYLFQTLFSASQTFSECGVFLNLLYPKELCNSIILSLGWKMHPFYVVKGSLFGIQNRNMPDFGGVVIPEQKRAKGTPQRQKSEESKNTRKPGITWAHLLCVLLSDAAPDGFYQEIQVVFATQDFADKYVPSELLS